MSLSKFAPWLFTEEEHEVSASEAEAVKRLFVSVLSKADAEAEAKKKSNTKNHSNDWLPLHYVAVFAKGRYSIEVFTTIFNAYPSAAKEKTSSGFLPLHSVARNMSGAEGLEAMQLLLEEYPQAAKEKNIKGWLPLHLVTRHMGGAEGLQAMQLLLAVYPQAAKGKQEDGWLPLHIVARYMGGVEGLQAMQLLLAECPQAAQEKEKDGFLPLHLVAFNMGGAEGLQAMQLLFAVYPQAAKEKNSNGDMPIHLICANESEQGATLEMVSELLSAHPEGINEKDMYNRKPHRNAAKRKKLPADAIDFLRRAEQDPSIIPPFRLLPCAVSAPAPASLPLVSASTANTPQAPAITAANAPVVFISLRFGEAMPEARALQRDLHARGVSAFLCDIPEGQDLANAVVMALTHCKLVVILGTKTYGKKTTSGFSTFEELRYIFEVTKPFFLVKMCTEFEEAETLFRLPSSISYFPWQPASNAERERLPAGLVDKVFRRLQDVTQGRSGCVTPPVAVVSGLGAASQAHSAAAGGGSIGVVHDLSEWLRSLKLDEFEPALRKLGAEDAHDVRDGFAAGDIAKEMLESEGLKPLRITRLQRAASKISDQ